ncbi:MAG: hypothetical protein GXP32_00520 [Kiritimatiellaeota bacterium]|nr:hypothetical protein [Kiritimatiellota bacterium]
MRHVEAMVEGKDWTAEHAPEKGSQLLLSLDGINAKVILDGISFDSLRERDALTEKVVRHDSLENDDCSVESTSVIPFGVEPAISRKFEYYLDTVRITTDITVRATTTVEKFNLDDLRVSGNWNRFAVVSPNPSERLPEKLDWKEIGNSAGETLWESRAVFAMILFETEKGERLEIGTGMDLWRWNAATDIERAEGLFSLTVNDTGELALTRSVLNYSAETEIRPRNWRFNWYIAWSAETDETAKTEIEEAGLATQIFPCPGDKPIRMEEGLKALTFTLAGTRWPEQALASLNDEKLGVPCFHSKLVRNHLRKTMRRIASAAPSSLRSIAISDFEPSLCDSGAHLERARQGVLPHWDLTGVIAFHLWASRLLRKRDISFKLSPPLRGIFKELPSLQSLAR